MKVIATATTVSGSVRAPSSKSALQRLIAGALMARGRSEIDASSSCEDSDAAFAIASALGAKTSRTANRLIIEGGYNPTGEELFCGESGLSARMFTPLAALHNSELIITGKGSLLKRPFDMATAPLEAMGVKVKSNNGYLPLSICGPVKGGKVLADGSVSSQFITGLLISLPYTSGESEIIVPKLVSRPYIDLTIGILSGFGVYIENRNYESFFIRGGQKFLPGNFIAEGDWSGASFLAVMGAIGGSVTLTGLDMKSLQADKAILEALSLAGAKIEYEPYSVKVSRNDLMPFRFNISDCPDLAPPLAVLALACSGTSVITGASRLSAKESDRAGALCKIISDIGGEIAHKGDIIEIEGGKRLKGGESDSFNDHRIAMALAVSSLLCDSPVTINRMESINKSYPGFIDHFTKLGGSIMKLEQ